MAQRLGGHVLPVNYAKAGKEIRRLLARTRPHAVVMLGLAERRRTLSLEAVALNVDHSEEKRNRRWRKPIGAGPWVRESGLPLDRLYRLLRRARIPANISYHAGTFICNHVFYRALENCRVPCGFIHVPPTRWVSLRCQMRAVRLVMEAI